jgi:hypothetical protein
MLASTTTNNASIANYDVEVGERTPLLIKAISSQSNNASTEENAAVRQPQQDVNEKNFIDFALIKEKIVTGIAAIGCMFLHLLCLRIMILCTSYPIMKSFVSRLTVFSILLFWSNYATIQF